MTHTGSPEIELRRGRVVSNVIRGCVGNLVEWYDWFAYAAFSVFFAKSFFPAEDPTAQLLSTAVVFAVGFLMRPLGGYVLGRFADRHGRKNALMLSVLMMAGGSLLIACAPPYEAIGMYLAADPGGGPAGAGVVGRR